MWTYVVPTTYDLKRQGDKKMGRPLNKKYFGNRNIGSASTTADDKIGGEGLGLYTLPTELGTVKITDTYKYFPALSIPAPTLVDGVPATATVVWEINTISLAGGTGFSAGAITDMSGSIWDDANIKPAFTVTVALGVPTFNVFTNRGEFTNINGTGITTWAVHQNGNTGDAQATVTFRLKSITTLEKGSGYAAVPSLTWTRASSQTAGGQTAVGTATVALTADSGAPGSSTNQENAITANAWVSGSRQKVDIVKQEASRRYAVRTATLVSGEPWSVRSALLVGKNSSADDEMDIKALDSAGNEYWVTKLTAHKARLTRKVSGSGIYATGEAAPWKFDAAVGIYVQIANA